jgi:hypothetical protein
LNKKYTRKTDGYKVAAGRCRGGKSLKGVARLLVVVFAADYQGTLGGKVIFRVKFFHIESSSRFQSNSRKSAMMKSVAYFLQ